MTSYVIFSGFCAPRVIWCADFELSIRLPFICVEIGTLEPLNTQKKNDNIYENLFFEF